MTQGAATCDELRRELSAFLDGELSAEKAVRLARHLERCDECRARYESEKAAVKRLKAVREPPVPPELRRRIIQELLDEDRRDRGKPPEG